MQMAGPDLETITAVIARSQIVVAQAVVAAAAGRVTRLPAGYEDIDRDILDWIAAESRGLRYRYLPI